MMMNTGDPYLCLQEVTDRYKGNRSSIRSVRESELPMVAFAFQRRHNFGRGKGQCLYHASEEEKERRLRNARNSGKDPATSEENIPEGQAAKGVPILSALYKVYRLDILTHAYNPAGANKGAPGVDGETFESIEERERGGEGYLKAIAGELKRKDHKPLPVRRVYIPKAGGGNGRLESQRSETEWCRWQ